MILVVAATSGELVELDGDDGRTVEALACGVGPVDAGIAVAARLQREPRPRLLLHVGVAGCRRGGSVGVGDLVLGSRAEYHDTSSRLVVDVAEPDTTLLARVRELLPDAHEAPIATSADVGGARVAGDCEVEAMEGFAVLRAAALAGVPAVELRAVSNEVEEPDRARWQMREALDALHAATAMLAARLALPT